MNTELEFRNFSAGEIKNIVEQKSALEFINVVFMNQDNQCYLYTKLQFCKIH